MPPVKTLRKRGWKKLRPRPNENNQREKILFFESILNDLPPSWHNNGPWTTILIDYHQDILMANIRGKLELVIQFCTSFSPWLN